MSRVIGQTRVAWPIAEWARAVAIGRTLAYELIAEGKIRSVTCGRKRLIITPPEEFIASLEAASKAA